MDLRTTIRQATTSPLALVIVLATGALLRLAVIADAGPSPHLASTVSMDEMNFMDLASNLLEFKTFAAWSEGFLTHSLRSPVYPSMLATTSWLTIDWAWSPQLLNLLLDTLNILLVYLLGTTLYQHRCGLAAACLHAFFGPAFLYLPFASSDILSVCLLLLTLLALVTLQTAYWRALPAFAVSYALLIHTKPAFLLILPFALVGIMLLLKPMAAPGRRMTIMAKALAPVLLTLLLCLPWGIRNYLIHHTLVPVCTVACWHLVCASQGEQDLLEHAMVAYVYAPEREGFAESDYFREGMAMSRTAFMENPLRVIAIGVARLVAGWTPWPPYRILLPHAYLFPLQLKGNYLLPLPDFEGLLYLFLFAVIAAAALRRRHLAASTALWLGPSAPILAIVVGYAAAHVIAIPLVQYRFVVEPVCVVLGVGFCARLLGMNEARKAVPFQAWLPAILATALALLTLAPLLLWKRPHPADYSAFMPHEADGLDFEEMRTRQWRSGGSLPDDTHASVAGVVRHLTPNWTFPPDQRRGTVSPGAAAARLYVRLNAVDTPLGTGDARLNFKHSPFPQEGDTIAVHGHARTGTYKDLIIDVETWRPLSVNHD